MLNAIAAGTAVLSLFTGPIIDTTPDVPKERITINVVNVIGSGCKPGSAAVAVSPDNTAFTVTYSEYLAEVGPGVKARDSRKNCQLNLNVHVPQGFTYAIASAEYRGFASLAKGAQAIHRANYYFQNTQPTRFVDHPLTGPMKDSWQANHEVGVAALVYKPCGAERFLNINTELRVDAGSSDPKASSFVAMDSTDGGIDTIYNFSWKKCKA